jgi:hypothetical protein
MTQELKDKILRYWVASRVNLSGNPNGQTPVPSHYERMIFVRDQLLQHDNDLLLIENAEQTCKIKISAKQLWLNIEEATHFIMN